MEFERCSRLTFPSLLVGSGSLMGIGRFPASASSFHFDSFPRFVRLAETTSPDTSIVPVPTAISSCENYYQVVLWIAETWKTYCSRGLSIRFSMTAQCNKLLSIDFVQVQNVLNTTILVGDRWWFLLVHIGVIQNSHAIQLSVSSSILGQ